VPVHVIGGGLAGSEAAWQLARAGVPAVLHEMRPLRGTEAHVTDGLAELVCSNSFRSDDAEHNAVGLLHEEMRRLGSLILDAGDRHRLPAGGALAVDREGFSAEVGARLAAEPLVEIRREEIAGLPPREWESVIVATGPLTAPDLAQAIGRLTGTESLAFFDAIAPIVYRDSIDLEIAWFQSRYDRSTSGGDGADYINCPLEETEYEAFLAALLAGETASFRDWERDTPYFEGCLPVEVMAARGPDTLRYGPMKPVGLTDPRSGRRPYAVVQLRQDNALGTLYNMVGFQTKLKYGEQARIFRMIPGLAQAEFARLGGLHRNTFLNAPMLLDGRLRLRADPRRADHRRRRLCRIGRHRPSGRPLRRRRTARTHGRPAADDNGARRPAGPHHRRRRRPQLPADERELRALSADGSAGRAAAQTQGPQAGPLGARPRRPGHLARRVAPGRGMTLPLLWR
jgi:methylenetetrahydrofolate--tRNA-(uracil-5-)-methyltransferase